MPFDPDLKPRLIIIAPQGEDFSSVSDEEFDGIKANFKAFTEITCKQYCDWAHIGNTVIGKSKREGLLPHDISATLKRYESIKIYQGAGNPPIGEDVLLDFDGFYAGHFSASCPKGINFFRLSGQDFIDSRFENSGSFVISNETFRIGNGISDIQPFYHRDKFYIVWRIKFTERPRFTYSYDATPTKLTFTETVKNSNGTTSYTRTYSYELIVQS